MKRCPACEQTWDDENFICPVDSNVLEEVAGTGGAFPTGSVPAAKPERAAAAPAVPPRSVNTAELLSSALDALEGRRSHDRAVALERMHQLEVYNQYCHGAWRFVHDLTSQSQRFGVTIRSLNEDSRNWVTYTLTIGEGKHLRSFPIKVVYDRETGHDVRVEIDLEQIGTSLDEQVFRTEEVGGLATNTRFGYSFLIAMPKDVAGEDGAVEWLRQVFFKIFRAAYRVS